MIARGEPLASVLTALSRQVEENFAGDTRWQGAQWLSTMQSLDLRSCRAAPIFSMVGRASGVLGIYRSVPSAAAFEAQEGELIDRFTKIAGIAIDRAQLDLALRTSERELRETLAQLSAGQQLSKTGSFSSDPAADRHRWSDELYRIVEIDPTSEPHMEMLRGRIHADDLQLFDKQIRRRSEGGDDGFTFRIVTPTAGLKYIRGISRRMERSGDRPVFMGALQDVTAGKLAEEALNDARSELAHVARVATLNAMTASIAHEVNQPISAILTNARWKLCQRISPPKIAWCFCSFSHAPCCAYCAAIAHNASSEYFPAPMMYNSRRPPTMLRFL